MSRVATLRGVVPLLLAVLPVTLAAQAPDEARGCGRVVPGTPAFAIALRDAPLADALAQLGAASGARLVYSRDLLPPATRVTLRCSATTLEHALRTLLAGTGLVATSRAGGLVVLVPASSATPGESAAPPLARADRPLELPRVATIADGEGGALRPAAVPPGNPGGARTVVGAADLAAIGAVQLGEALGALVPGFAAWGTGTSGTGLRVAAVRGASSTGGPSLKVYVDGVELASGANLAALDARDIERLEVLRGPAASALHGSDALDGVVLVTTRAARDGAPGHLRVQGTVRTGAGATAFAPSPVRLADAVLTVEQRLPLGTGRDAVVPRAGIAWSATVNGSHAGAVTPSARTEAAAARATLRGWRGPLSAELTLRLAEGRASPAFRATEALIFPVRPVGPGRDPVVPVVDSIAAAAARERTAGRTLGLTLRAQGRRAAHALVVGVDRLGLATDSVGTIVRTAPDSARWAWPGTVTRLGARWGAQVAVHDTPGTSLALAIGAEAARLTQAGTVTTVVGGIRRDTSLARDMLATTLAITARHASGFGWHAGLRAERNDAVGRDVGLAWLPSVGLAWERALAGAVRLRLRAGAGTSVRAPDPLASVARRSAALEQRANPSLGLERQRGVEGSVELLAGEAMALGVTRYAQRVDGLLQLVTIGAEVDGQVNRRILQFQQVGRLRNDGWEVTARLRHDGWQLLASGALMPSRVVALDPRYTGPLAVGDQMLDAPVRSGALTVARTVGRTALAGGVAYTGPWRALDLRCTLTDERTGRCTALGAPRRFAGIVRPWLSVTHPLGGRLELQLRAENLGGTQRGEGNALLVGPGRTVLFGLLLRP